MSDDKLTIKERKKILRKNIRKRSPYWKIFKATLIVLVIVSILQTLMFYLSTPIAKYLEERIIIQMEETENDLR